MKVKLIWVFIITPLALIFSGDTDPQYYSNKYGPYDTGKTHFVGIWLQRGITILLPDQGGLRLDKNDFLTMESFDELFYVVPQSNVQDYIDQKKPGAIDQ